MMVKAGIPKMNEPATGFIKRILEKVDLTKGQIDHLIQTL